MLGKLRVEPGSVAELSKRTTDGRAELAGKAEAKQELAKLIEEFSLLHNRLYAEASRSLLLILQGLDASGKDGTIRSVPTGGNPQGCRIVPVNVPTSSHFAC